MGLLSDQFSITSADDLKVEENQMTIEKLAEVHKDALKALSIQLATNFEVPAPRLINRAISQMGIDRVTYEKIVCFQNGWEFDPIPEELLDRWARY